MKHLAILVVVLVGLVSADTYGDYVPKAFFKIDENGNPSPIRPILEKTLNRMRRQIQPFQPFGFPAFQPVPIQPFVAGPGQGQGSFVSSSQTLNSRFGEDDAQTSHQSTIITSKDGKYQQTNTYTNPDGHTYVNKQSGRVRRQQTQLQSQNGEAGKQQQTQSQNQPGGSQIQSQSQGPAPTQPAHAPAGGNQHVDNRNPQPAHQQPQQPQPAQPEYAPQQPQPARPEYQPQPNQPQYQPQPDQQQYQPQPDYQGQPPVAENRNPQSYPQGGYAQQPFGFNPFGLGAFGPTGFAQPGFGQPAFGQQGFGQPGFPQAGFGFPQAGFGFPQPGFGAAPFPGGVPQQGSGSRLDSRFNEDDDSTGGSTGGTFTSTSNNGVFRSTSTVVGPDGKVHTRHQSGRY